MDSNGISEYKFTPASITQAYNRLHMVQDIYTRSMSGDAMTEDEMWIAEHIDDEFDRVAKRLTDVMLWVMKMELTTFNSMNGTTSLLYEIYETLLSIAGPDSSRFENKIYDDFLRLQLRRARREELRRLSSRTRVEEEEYRGLTSTAADDTLVEVKLKEVLIFTYPDKPTWEDLSSSEQSMESKMRGNMRRTGEYSRINFYMTNRERMPQDARLGFLTREWYRD